MRDESTEIQSDSVQHFFQCLGTRPADLVNLTDIPAVQGAFHLTNAMRDESTEIQSDSVQHFFQCFTGVSSAAPTARILPIREDMLI